MNTTDLSKRWIGCLAVVGWLTAGSLSAAEIDDTLNHSFPVDPGGRLVLDVDRGSVEVQGVENASSVVVEVTRKASARSEARARELLEDHQVEFSQDGTVVEVKGRSSRASSWSWFRGQNLQVNYRITVPRRFQAQLRTAGGSIQVTTVEGEVQAKTSGGALKFGELKGPINGRTSGGSISAKNCQGELDVETSGGGIQLGEIQGNVKAHTSGGSIHAAAVTGRCTVSTSGGGIDLTDITGLSTASTSGGSITVSLTKPLEQDCTVESSGGGITVRLPEAAAFDVDARTSGGGVRSDFPVTMVVQGEQKRGVLQGKVNGGGPKLTAHTSGGSIRIQKR